MAETETKNKNEMITGNVLPSKLLCKEPKKEEAKQTKSGLYIPESIIKHDQIIADVVKTGYEHPSEEKPITIGHRVIFNPHSPQKVEIDGESYLLIDFRDVLYYFMPQKE